MVGAAVRATSVACLVLAATGAAPFDPPFAFPGLEKQKGKGVVPTEQQFTSACFNFVYGLLHKGGDKPLRLRATALPDALMKSCLQQDKKGCKRFAQQLEKIVEAKSKEGPIGHVRKAKAESKAHAPEVPKPKPSPIPVAADKHDSKVVTKKKATAAGHAPGHRLTQEERAAEEEKESLLQVADAPAAFAQDFANFGIDGAAAVATPATTDYALLDASDSTPKLGLIDNLRRPLRYNDWCSNLYAVATATYEPSKAKVQVPVVQAKALPVVHKAAHATSHSVAKAVNATKAANATKTSNSTEMSNSTKASNSTNATAAKKAVVPAKNATKHL